MIYVLVKNKGWEYLFTLVMNFVLLENNQYCIVKVMNCFQVMHF